MTDILGADVNAALQLRLDYLQKRMDELEARNVERITGVKDNTAAALASAERAIAKAEIATDKRFESVNEFRQTLTDQNNQFIRADTYSTAHRSLVERTDLLSNQLIAINTVLQSAPKPISNASLFIGIGSILAIFVVSMITGAIQLGSVQTHVEVNTGVIKTLQQLEHEHRQEASRLAVETNAIGTRMNQNEARLDRLESRLNTNPR